MSKAEKFIRDCTRNCSNQSKWGVETPNKSIIYVQPWLTPDDARRAVEIAKEEIIEWIEDNIKELYQVARNIPWKKFMVAYRSAPEEKTLCGYKGRELFNCFLRAGDIPDNVYFSEEWYNMVK